jgi:hypothetical protein
MVGNSEVILWAGRFIAGQISPEKRTRNNEGFEHRPVMLRERTYLKSPKRNARSCRTRAARPRSPSGGHSELYLRRGRRTVNVGFGEPLSSFAGWIFIPLSFPGSHRRLRIISPKAKSQRIERHEKGASWRGRVDSPYHMGANALVHPGSRTVPFSGALR